MAIIKCKMCGGDIELAAEKTYGMCEFCGNTMTLPKIDDDQRAAAFNRGNHFRRIGEFDKALTVYERIVREDDTDAEAHWCCALCRFGIEYVEDPATYEWIPTCHRASFDSFQEDVDYRAALEYSDGITRRQYQRDAAKIAEVQRGILATSQNTEPYDVFICYKESDEHGDRTRDSLMAQDIYYQLTEQGRKVFFARITLEDVAGAQYEPYIFAALNSAKVMIVVGTKPEHLNAVWVKNEWSRFLAMMKKDRHKLLLPCYRDMDPYDMPEALSVLQSYDMSKIGFIQDLIRGVAKVLDIERKPEPVREATMVQQSFSSNIVALLKRGNMALEDREWDKAERFFEEVLNHDAECANAYLGSFLAGVQAPNLTCLFEKEMENMLENAYPEERISEQENLIWEEWVNHAVEAYAETGILSHTQIMTIRPQCTQYHSYQAYWKENRAHAVDYLSGNKQLQRALKFSDPAFKATLQHELDTWIQRIDSMISETMESDAQQENAIIQNIEAAMEKANDMLTLMREKAIAAKEAEYQKLCDYQKIANDKWALKSLKNSFMDLGAYKDSPERAEYCRKRIVLLEKEHIEKAEHAKKVSEWVANNRCAYCGGSFTGVFSKKCSRCGKVKSY